MPPVPRRHGCDRLSLQLGTLLKRGETGGGEAWLERRATVDTPLRDTCSLPAPPVLSACWLPESKTCSAMPSAMMSPQHSPEQQSSGSRKKTSVAKSVRPSGCSLPCVHSNGHQHRERPLPEEDGAGISSPYKGKDRF